MKVLLISDGDEPESVLTREFGPREAVIVHYRHPIKAMDNLDEIAPDAVIFSGQDFPRHWKIFLVYLRALFQDKNTPFFLLTGDSFDSEEISKSQQLGVTGILSEDLRDSVELKRLKHSLVPCDFPVENATPEVQDSGTVPLEDVELLFSHPDNFILVQARVTSLTRTGLHCSPLVPEICKDLAPHSQINSCSLRIGEDILTVDLELEENTHELIFRLTDTAPLLSI